MLSAASRPAWRASGDAMPTSRALRVPAVARTMPRKSVDGPKPTAQARSARRARRRRQPGRLAARCGHCVTGRPAVRAEDGPSSRRRSCRARRWRRGPRVERAASTHGTWSRRTGRQMRRSIMPCLTGSSRPRAVATVRRRGSHRPVARRCCKCCEAAEAGCSASSRPVSTSGATAAGNGWLVVLSGPALGQDSVKVGLSGCRRGGASLPHSRHVGGVEAKSQGWQWPHPQVHRRPQRIRQRGYQPAARP